MQKNYAIIDIETTGGSAHRERITEIAIVIHDGEKEVDRFESLVNPERSIPPFITRLTGIDNEMVKKAPKFYEIAKDIVELTEGCIFVAHNVRFDYGFVQEEFKRLGYHYSRKQLCTVRMSRQAFPGLRSYSLGNLIQHFNIEVSDRHRAMADVEATIEVFKKILIANDDRDASKLFIKNALRNVLLPGKISPDQIMDLPQETGVYYFRDDAGSIIYIGKSINIRKRIKQHFQNINPKSNKLYQRASRIDFQLTGSEMVAFLLESEEIKAHQPDVNRASRKKSFKYFIHHYINEEGYHVFDYETNTITNRKNKQVLSEFVNLLSVKSALNYLRIEYELCEKYLGLNPGPGSCFYHGIDQCNGACLLEEDPDNYNVRASLAAKSMDLLKPENFLMIDKGRSLNEISVVAVKEGKFHGFSFFDKEVSIADPGEFLELIPEMNYYPEKNTIIKRFLDNPGGIRIIEF